MSAKPSRYEEIIIESNDGSKTVDIRFGVASIDYYEDIFSPIITTKIIFGNTGTSVKGKDDKFQSLYDGLPIRGGERLSLKIGPNSNSNKGLDFATNPNDYLYVSSITNVITESQREFFVLNLVSREAITNETTRVPIKFPTSSPIDVSVKKILTDYLKTEKPVDIDETSNKYGFIGNLKKPFTLLVWLASKAVPTVKDGVAGFLFYQTQEGFKFKAIDKLITQEPKATYVYNAVNQSDIERDNDFIILQYTTERNQNLLEKLRLGAFASFRTAFNPINYKFTLPQEGLFKYDNYANKTKNLGQPVKLPPITNSSNQTLGEIPTRIISQIIDIGTFAPGVSLELNANPWEYQSQSIMRYNLLFTQVLNMTIPLNTNLKAGDIIECKFPKVTNEQATEYDDEKSGLYMIKELCHHFDDEISLTSMKLIRDTFGAYGTNNKQ